MSYCNNGNHGNHPYLTLSLGGGVDQEEGETEMGEEVVSDAIRNRATSDVTNISTAKYQYLMKVPVVNTLTLQILSFTFYLPLPDPFSPQP